MIPNNKLARITPAKQISTWTPVVLTVLFIGLFAVLTSLPLLAQEQPGYTYAVQRGDNWDTVAARTGIPVETLQAANPQAIRENLWLRIGDDLFVPTESVSLTDATSVHTVKFGESWSIIAAKYDVPIRLLQAVNPDSIRTDLVLYRDEELLIPPAIKLLSEETENESEESEPNASQSEETQPEDAQPEDLQAETASEANNASVETSEAAATAIPQKDAASDNSSVLLSSSKEPAVEILDSTAADAQATAAANISAAQQAAAEEAQAASAETDVAAVESSSITSAAILTATSSISSVTSTTASTATVTSAAASNVDESGCPNEFSDYPNPIEAALTGPDGTPQKLRDFLANCGAEVLFQIEDWTADGVNDLLIIYKNPDKQNPFTENDLMIFNGTSPDRTGVETDEELNQGSFELKYRARSASTVNLITTEDMNKDGQFDIAWLETTCGASTCFSTVNIRSWNGSEWADWTDETITMAYADVTRQEIEDESGQIELVLSGGMNGSSGAGPQRPRTETWRSINGAPYSMVEQIYDESPCLYFAAIDANAALESGEPEGLAKAAELYRRIATDRSLIACNWRENEEEELRSYGRFRTALMAAYQGDSSTVANQIEKLESNHAHSAYAELGQIWFDAYQESGDPESACAATDEFVEETPETWEILADYGYTNPTFSAEEVCPQIGRLAAVLQIVESATVEELLPGNRDGEEDMAASEADAPEATVETEEVVVPEADEAEATAEPAEEIAPEFDAPEIIAEPVEEAAPETGEAEATAEPAEEAAPEADTPEATVEPVEEAAPEAVEAEATVEPVEEATPEADTPEATVELVEEAAPEADALEATAELAEEAAPETGEAEATAEPAEEAAPEADTPEAPEEAVEEAAPEADTPEATVESVEEAAPEADTPESAEEAVSETNEADEDSAIMKLAIVPNISITNTDEMSDTVDGESDGEDNPETESSQNEGIAVKEVPACPQSLDQYGEAGQQALNYAAGDVTAVKKWMLDCGVMTDEQGAIVVQDITGNGLNDIVLYPVVIDSAGYGPEGTQGSVLIYHQLPASDDPEVEQFFLAANPDVFGKPEPIGIDDFNEDGSMDVAWTVEGCYTFCVTEVQLLTWNGEYYFVNIAPGATIAEGQAIFRPIEQQTDESDSSLDQEPVQGQELVLTGGVSGTPEGGLSVPHEEIWQSINGSPYQRVSWTYDRDIDYNDCMGLRLVEADTALQSGPIGGYDKAIELYINAINPVLKACSIYGMPQETEIIALQGLASFRLAQAQALNGDIEAAELTMAALSRGQPDSVYTALTKQWIGEYRLSEDPASACEMIQPMIDDNDMIWQITDHYGYNHPALAPEQICFQPIATGEQ